MTVSPALRVDGVWLAAAGLPCSDLSWTDRADGGNFEASWSIALPYGSRPAPLYRTALVEVFLGPVRRWYGEVSMTDWNSGTFTATGMSQRAYDMGARSASGQTSSTADTVIDTSIVYDGWRVMRPESFNPTPLVAGDVMEDQSTVGAILDQTADLINRRWGVWGDGRVVAQVTPTVHDYVLAPGVIELGETTEDAFTRVLGRYIDSGTGTRQPASAFNSATPAFDLLQDLTNFGPISAATATSLLQNVLALGGSSPGWTNGVEVTSAQLLTPGGLPADLASVTAGQMVRALVTGSNGQSFQDLVIGETKYSAGADVLSLSPVNKVAENFSEVIEDAYTRITGQPVAA